MAILFDLQQIRNAGRRFQQHVKASPQRDAIESAKAATESTLPGRRAAYLARTAAKDHARALVYKADAAATPRSQTDTIRTLSQERILGRSDLLDINYMELAIAVGRAVCRVRLANGFGTGFLVGPGLLMTNHHVIEREADCAQALAQFDYQEDMNGQMLPSQNYRLRPELFFETSDELDYTVVGVDSASLSQAALDRYPWVKLIATLGKADKGDPLNIIQHPRGGLKQIAFRNNDIIDLPQSKKEFLYYTTDTEPGSSGSPCFNDQWELVALHHSGVPEMQGDQIMKKDGTAYRDGVDDPAQIKWIANEGVRVSAIVASLQAAALTSSERQQLDAMLDSPPPNPVELARGAAPSLADADGKGQASGVGVTKRAGEVSLTVPLRITVSLGDGKSAGASTVTGAVAAGRAAVDGAQAGGTLEKVVIDPNWANRDGYDSAFLTGFNIPLPKLSAAQEADTAVVPPEFRKDGKKFILNYYHYALAMNKKRRMAWFSAACVDGDRRFTLPDREDDWFIDPRIDDPDNYTIQMGEELYAEKKTDRGHLTRYLDVAWGDTKEMAIKATNDSFHFTNCALQVSAFNQSKSRWQGLERFLLELKSRKEKRRIIVITGPVFKADDPVYRNSHMDYSARLALEFWKVCAIVRQDGTLAATGFKLAQQEAADLPDVEEAFNVIAAQVTIADLEELTGLDFGILADHDHFAAGGAPGTLEVARPGGGKRKVKLLRSEEDIVV